MAVKSKHSYLIFDPQPSLSLSGVMTPGVAIFKFSPQQVDPARESPCCLNDNRDREITVWSETDWW